MTKKFRPPSLISQKWEIGMDFRPQSTFKVVFETEQNIRDLQLALRADDWPVSFFKFSNLLFGPLNSENK